MVKISPEERWRRHILERLASLRQSGELNRLRKKGLAILGRKKRFTPEGWFKSCNERVSRPEYVDWHDECETVGRRFGLAPWTVVCSCLVSKYDPRKQPFVIEAQWPRIRIVTENTNPLFLQWLSYEAHKLGLYTVGRQGSVETTVLNILPPCGVLPPSLKPPRDNAFVLRIETPPGYPPEAAQKLQKKGERLAKELLRRLGYSIPQRLRGSTLVAMAAKLRVADNKLAVGEAYNIIDDLYGENDITQDQKRRKLVASRRHKLRKRLIEQYKPDI